MQQGASRVFLISLACYKGIKKEAVVQFCKIAPQQNYLV
jgi:hypothetical protein